MQKSVLLPNDKCPSGVYTGTGTFQCLYYNDMDSGIECTVSKFADDTKVNGAVHMFGGRDIVQRDLEKLEEWAQMNFMKFSKVKCKALHLGQDNQYQYRMTGLITTLQKRFVCSVR